MLDVTMFAVPCGHVSTDHLVLRLSVTHSHDIVVTSWHLCPTFI